MTDGRVTHSILPRPGPLTVKTTVPQCAELFGLGFSLPIRKFRPFVETAFGVGHMATNHNGTSPTFAEAFGGGVDYKLFTSIARRVEGADLFTRFFSATQQNFRLSSGIVFRF
jgi:hypothetical protein